MIRKTLFKKFDQAKSDLQTTTELVEKFRKLLAVDCLHEDTYTYANWENNGYGNGSNINILKCNICHQIKPGGYNFFFTPRTK